MDRERESEQFDDIDVREEKENVRRDAISDDSRTDLWDGRDEQRQEKPQYDSRASA
jgi:hypothetical protein